MPRTRIKICGVTHPDDARLAADAGADAVGVVLHAEGARRLVGVYDARRIYHALPPYVTPVGVLRDAAAKVVRQAARALILTEVQLHGTDDVAELGRLGGLSVAKSMHATPDLPAVAEAWRGQIAAFGLPVSAVHLEPQRSAGGSGIEHDWDALDEHLGRLDLAALPRIIFAGGLTPENVGGVVRRFRPYAVDVSSGVEGDVYGRKDAAKVRAFVEAVRAADADYSPPPPGEGQAVPRQGEGD